MRLITPELRCYEPDIQIEFHGDLGETGLFNLNIDSLQFDQNKNSNNNNEIVNYFY